MGCAPLEALTISTVQDRALAALAQHEVDRGGHPLNEGNDRRLVAVADDAERLMSSIKAEIFHVGRTGLAHPESVQAKEHRQGGMVTVVTLGGEEEGTQLSAVEASTFARVDLGAPDDALPRRPVPRIHERAWTVLAEDLQPPAASDSLPRDAVVDGAVVLAQG